MNPTLVSSEPIFNGKVFDIRRDTLRRSDGQLSQVDVVEHGGAVTMLPIDNDGLIWFVRQYRHPVKQFLLELPAGTLEQGEDPSLCAERECREEIGVKPGQLTYLGRCYLAPGYTSEENHLFLARDLVPAPLPADADEQIEIEKYTLAEVQAMIAAGELIDAKTIVALYMARHSLGSFT